ncbi:hypothetical protein ADK66_19035 [Micromonospora sp. NRRL B-16802]|nr:hypothetical protein ADK66_19035 [Micromonospora sp. NRRL B-16802]
MRLIDAPAVGWTVACAFTTSRRQAIAVAPLCSYMLPDVRHFGRTAVVNIHRRGEPPRTATTGNPSCAPDPARS